MFCAEESGATERMMISSMLNFIEELILLTGAPEIAVAKQSGVISVPRRLMSVLVEKSGRSASILSASYHACPT